MTNTLNKDISNISLPQISNKITKYISKYYKLSSTSENLLNGILFDCLSVFELRVIGRKFNEDISIGKREDICGLNKHRLITNVLEFTRVIFNDFLVVYSKQKFINGTNKSISGVKERVYSLLPELGLSKEEESDLLFSLIDKVVSFCCQNTQNTTNDDYFDEFGVKLITVEILSKLISDIFDFISIFILGEFRFKREKVFDDFLGDFEVYYQRRSHGCESYDECKKSYVSIVNLLSTVYSPISLSSSDFNTSSSTSKSKSSLTNPLSHFYIYFLLIFLYSLTNLLRINIIRKYFEHYIDKLFCFLYFYFVFLVRRVFDDSNLNSGRDVSGVNEVSTSGSMTADTSLKSGDDGRTDNPAIKTSSNTTTDTNISNATTNNGLLKYLPTSVVEFIKCGFVRCLVLGYLYCFVYEFCGEENADESKDELEIDVKNDGDESKGIGI